MSDRFLDAKEEFYFSQHPYHKPWPPKEEVEALLREKYLDAIAPIAKKYGISAADALALTEEWDKKAMEVHHYALCHFVTTAAAHEFCNASGSSFNLTRATLGHSR